MVFASSGVLVTLKEPPIVVRHLNQEDLAERWNISTRTLERWRWIGEGVRFVKIGGRVRYRLDDIEAYEEQQLRTSTSDIPPPPVLARKA